MSPHERLAGLLQRWEAERVKGRIVTAEELCRDCPELRADLDRQIRARLGPEKAGSLRPSSIALTTDAPPAPPTGPTSAGTNAPSRKDTVPDGSHQRPDSSDTPTLASDEAPALVGQTPSATAPQPSIKVADTAKETLVSVGGGYRKVKRLGRGSFAEVWKAEAPGGVKVALKILNRPDDHEEAQRELQALDLVCGLRHPFLLQAHGYWTVDDHLHVAMELADCTLRDRLKKCREQGLEGIPLEELLPYIRHAAEALDFLHQQRVQHRDVKPENILLVGNFAKLADFGLARSQGSRQLASMSVGGTPMYMAPEVWTGQVSSHTDQYALALTYAELRLGRRIFLGNDLVALMQLHLGSMPRFDPLPEAEQAVLTRALAKEPAQRYPSCRAFVEALEEACRPKPAPPPEPPPPEPPRRWLVAVLVLLLLGAGATVFALVNGSKERSTVPAAGTFQVEAPAPLFLFPGEQGTGNVSLRRDRFSGAVGLQARAGDVAPVRVAATAETTEEQLPFTVMVPTDAPWGTHQVVLDADGGGQHREVVLVVHVLYRPSADWQRVGEQQDRDGRWFAEHLRRTIGDQTVEMILIPGSAPQTANEPELATYFMMKGKVTVGMFRSFAAQQKLTSQVWQEAIAGEKHPVLGVNVVDAYRCARWLGGNLPTVDEWDKAAGLYRADRGEGPFRGQWDPKQPLKIAVGGLEKPQPASSAEDDISWCGCRDMAGNGFEWTRNLQGPARHFVPVEKPTPSDFVMLRGQSFNKLAPLTFAQLSKGKSGAFFYQKEGNDIGFRVVLEPGSPGPVVPFGSSIPARAP
jgi:serine/threonine protein kinase